MLAVNKCCFCASLRTGSLIIGYLRLVSIVILWTCTFLSLDTVCETMEIEVPTDETARAYIFWFIMTLHLTHLVFTIMLLVGVYKNKRGLVEAFVIFLALVLVTYCIWITISIANEATTRKFIKLVSTVVLNLYFLLVTYSHYIKMNEPKPERLFNKV